MDKTPHAPAGGPLEGLPIYIRWYDAATLGGHNWREKAELDELKLPQCETMGWVLRQDDAAILVIGTRDVSTTAPDQTAWGEFIIPVGCIIECRELKKSRRRAVKIKKGKRRGRRVDEAAA